MLSRRSGMNLRAWSARLASLTLLAVSAVWPAHVRAQLPLQAGGSPFEMVGFIQSATLDQSDDLFSGGTITLNNQVVTVPRNTIFQMPATSLTWQELFKIAPPPYGFGSGPSGQAQTGMAMSDAPQPATTYEVFVQGNRMGDTYIAALIFLSQHSLNTADGFINYIDYANGELRVGGTPGVKTTGRRLRINDPIGRFGPAASPDVRFSIDEDNPTIKAETSYPMCLPRTDPFLVADDPLCPQGNRPRDPATNKFLMAFTMPAQPPLSPAPGAPFYNPVAVAAARTRTLVDAKGVPLPDPYRMAPFEVGDHITYKGTVMKDASGPYTSVWGIDASVGIYTARSTRPAYVSIDVLLMGTGPSTGDPAANALVEAAAKRMRVEGFTTDLGTLNAAQIKRGFVGTSVSINAVDVDPCTGEETDRPWAVQEVDQGPPVGALAGRFRFRPGAPLFNVKAFPFLPPTREAHAILIAQAPVAISSNSVGSATIITTATPHPFATGDSVVISGVTASVPSINNTFTVTVRTPTTFSIAVKVTTAGKGGTVRLAPVITLNGLSAGEYQAPNFQFILAENLKVGGNPIPGNFDTMAFLSQGSGPWHGPRALQTALPQGIMRRLSPWPGPTVPANPACAAALPSTQPPVAEAGNDLHIPSGNRVDLDASTSKDPNVPAQSLIYSWTQISGPPVPGLAGANGQKANFTGPMIPGTAPAAAYQFVLTVTNGTFASTSTVTKTVDPGLPPNVRVGADQMVIKGAAVKLDASASTDPNTPRFKAAMTYSWAQAPDATQPAIALAGANTATPTFVAPAGPAKPQFVVTVDNGTGVTKSATTAITIVAPPVPDAGQNRMVASAATATLDASASKDPNAITPPLKLTYAWTQTSGTAVTLSDASAVQPTFVAPTTATTQTLGFQVTVSNGFASSAPASTTVTVEAPPLADAGKTQTVAAGAAPVTLDASASRDPNTNTPPLPLTYSWKQISGTSVTLSDATAVKPTFTAPAAPATLGFTLTVSNGVATSAPATVAVTVVAPPAVTTTGDQKVATGATVTLDASGSRDPNTPPLSPLTYAWVQQAGENPTVALTGATPAAQTFTAPATPATLHLTVTVGNGVATSTATVTVTVVGPPTAIASNQVVSSGSPVTLTGSGTDPNTPALPLSFAWSEPATQGTALTGTNPVTFTAPTLQPTDTAVALTFTLTASNGVSSGTSTVTVTVNPPPAPVVAPLTVGLTGSSSNASATVSLTASLAGGVGARTVVFFDGTTVIQGGNPTTSADGSTVTVTDAPLVAPGPHSITAVVTDSAGPTANTATSNIVSLP